MFGEVLGASLQPLEHLSQFTSCNRQCPNSLVELGGVHLDLATLSRGRSDDGGLHRGHGDALLLVVLGHQAQALSCELENHLC